jgi:NAD(P)-dependent dehydrogenase (short-subunit alcohol dehydrogenase family)
MPAPRVALVSGANRGIGLEIGRQLASRGIAAVLGSRDRAKGEAAAALLRQDRVDASVVALDVTDGESVRAAVDEVLRQHGRIDILVNNAAILIDGPGGFNSSLFEATEVTFRDTFDANVAGPLRLIQSVVPVMRAGGYGRIVNMSSGAGQFDGMGMGFPIYRMSKSALNALTVITAAELGRGTIKINAVCPGWVKTDMGGPNAERSVEKGAETPVWLATLPDDGPTGGFFRDKKRISW